MANNYIFVKLNETNSELDQFKIRKKDEVFLRKILVMLESNHI